MEREPAQSVAHDASHGIPPPRLVDAAVERNAFDAQRTAVFLGGLYALIMLPILRADRLYNDDLRRSLAGHTGWDTNGRPLTSLLMKLLQCFDGLLVDVSPFTQLAAVAMLVWIGVLLARRFCRSSALIAALVVFPIGAQPFFLENLSYKFDALSMALAMLLALIPFASHQQDRRSWSLGVLALFCCLNLYQPALNGFLIFMGLEVLLLGLQGGTPKTIGTTLRFRIGQLLLSGVVYEVLVGIHVNGWVKLKSAPVHGIDQVAANAVHFLQNFAASFNAQWWMYFGPLLVALALVPVVIAVRYAMSLRATQRAWLVAMVVVVGVLSPLLAIGAALGPLLTLADPPLNARVFVGIGPLLCAALIALDAALRAWRISQRWTLFAAGMLAIGFAVIASAYGNASRDQKAYEEHIARQLADDIAEISARAPLHALLLDGSAGSPAATAHVIEQFPIMTSLIPLYLDASDQFRPQIFLRHFLPASMDLSLVTSSADMQHKQALLDAVCTSRLVQVRSAYRLYVQDDVAVALLGDAFASRCAGKDSSGRTSLDPNSNP